MGKDNENTDFQENGNEDVQKRSRRPGKKKKRKPAEPEQMGQSSIFYLHSFFLFGGRFLSKILDVYNGLFDIGPKDKSKIYRNISTHYANKGLHERSLGYLKEWAQLDPSNPDAHYQLGVALTASGNKKSALGAFDKVLKLSPKHKGAIFRKSSLQIKMKDFKSAIKELESLVKQVEDNPKVYYLLGIAYEGLEEVDQAIEALQKAIELDPDEVKYHQHLGFLNVRKDDHKTAAKSFTKVMELERDQEEDDEF